MFKLKYKLLLAAITGFFILIVPATALAATPITCPDGYETTITPIGSAQEVCADHQTGTQQGDAAEAQQAAAAASDPGRGGDAEANCDAKDAEGNALPLDKDNCGIVYYIVTFTNILSAVVGIVIVVMIAVGGIQYTTARDDPQAVSAAKHRIQNAVLALVFYLFGFAFLQYLIPGGIF